MELKVKDFAAAQGVSESIVYRHIRQHKEALGDRVIKRAKATWLTDAGQQYIRDLMIQQPIVVGDSDVIRKMQQLEEENKQLTKDLQDALRSGKELFEQLKGYAQLQLDAEVNRRTLELAQGEIQEKDTEIADLRTKYNEQVQKAAETAQELAEEKIRVNTLEDDKNALEGKIKQFEAELKQKTEEAAAKAREEAEREFENRTFRERFADLFKKKGK